MESSDWTFLEAVAWAKTRQIGAVERAGKWAAAMNSRGHLRGTAALAAVDNDGCTAPMVARVLASGALRSFGVNGLGEIDKSMWKGVDLHNSRSIDGVAPDDHATPFWALCLIESRDVVARWPIAACVLPELNGVEVECGQTKKMTALDPEEPPKKRSGAPLSPWTEQFRLIYVEALKKFNSGDEKFPCDKALAKAVREQTPLLVNIETLRGQRRKLDIEYAREKAVQQRR